MVNRELRKLNRAELLEMLVKASEENERLQAEQDQLNEEIQRLLAERENRIFQLEEAGSIAEASLRVNDVFETAQKAANQYLENIQYLRDNMQSKADTLLRQTEERCAALEAETRQRADAQLAVTQQRCDALTAQTQQEVEAQWATLKSRLDAYCQAHEELKEQLGSFFTANVERPIGKTE